MVTIHLHNLQFFAHHGLHDEEAITGTDFSVSVDIFFDPGEKITSIHQTINYTEVYQLVERYMSHPVALLEMLAENICDAIYSMDKRIKNINISINKLHPPISNFIGSVGVTFHKAY
ncbi:MAG: dihydroneopterin aldolase [Bacteroidetes bacterium]|nr:dihydroneopterin aldolase [Bacteroidota bacterium]